jgi:Sulfotransferase domain
LRKSLSKPLRKLRSNLYLDMHRDARHCSAFISGAGRSGTTWLAEIIASQIYGRIIFEPFYLKVMKAAGLDPLGYISRSAQNEPLLAYCRDVLSGRIRHEWTDRQVKHTFPRYRVVKEVRSNFFLRWFAENFPSVPILFIIRHPCAVVLSRMQFSRIEDGWDPDVDIDFYLSQRELVADFLSDKLEIIEKAQTAEERHAVYWCINNLVPLKQFHGDELNIVFYENLCVHPNIELHKIFQRINHQYDDLQFSRYVERPASTVLPSSAILTGEDKMTRWRTVLSPEQIQKVLSIVRAFGLDHLYGDSVVPL